MTKRMKGLDPIRLFALFGVLIYHFFPAIFPAGFLGVDILFVLSGFLITGLAFDEIEENGKFSFTAFMQKRVFRILPSLIFMVGLTGLFAYFFSPDYRVQFGRQSAAAIGSVTNWYEIVTGGSYESQFIKHVFLHTWTLGIEMHFYLIWGFLLSHLSMKARRKRRMTRRTREIGGLSEKGAQKQTEILRYVRARVWRISIILLIFSVAVLWIGALLGKTSFLYFSDFSRMGAFFMGSMAACLTGMRATSPRFSRMQRISQPILYTMIGLGIFLFVLLFKKLSYASKGTYFFGFLLSWILSGVMIFSFRILHEKARWEEPRWLGKASMESYGVYLFHWPIFVLLDTRVPHIAAVLLAFMLSIGLTIFADRLWTPSLLGKRGNVNVRQFGKISLQKIALGVIFLFLVNQGISSAVAPKMTSLEKSLWQQSLNQQKDTIVGQMEDALHAQQEMYQHRKEEQAAEAQAFLKEKGVTIIGDSVTLSMRDALLKSIANSTVDGKVSRFLHDGDDVLKTYIDQKRIGGIVVMALGTNIYPRYERDTQSIIGLLPAGHRLIFVTPYDSRSPADSDMNHFVAYARTLEEKYNYITIADWNAVATEHPELFEGTDGVHLNPNRGENASYFVNCIQDAILRATQKPAKEE